ncbi:serine/threonine-protein phosphatase 4 regulatory subunit 3 isoform X2 [Solanum tuberosum]|uniref:serine/threonine-protein phosphatase 4 regulatory subunit 3 isoform X2 n=1 Tax=Solanum tuberosum TaxID=4113 RepID=UPI00073A2B2C|nr:PREDICTED: serine/threonine-protein phosphatase 4 regulatory subunit 3 isoform X2 [Solanum tuberosum]
MISVVASMGAQEKSSSTNNSMQRVKVYRLNDDGKWDDQGTGHVTVDYLERSEEPGLLVTDEDEHETLLMHRISAEDIYRKQEDTIISWRDPEYSTELALSFQETTGCSYIWDSICSVQRNMQFSSLNYETFHSASSDLRELPPVELSTLPLILKIVVESGVADQLRVTELILHDQDFFGKLMDLFRICEDLENVDSLHIIFKIVRGINDPEAPHIHHRSFLKEHVVYKEAIPIKDSVVLSKIRQTYRVGYLKDVVLSQMLDEITIANLNSIISSNNAMVVSRLKDDNTFIQELFAKLRSPSTSAESKKNLIHFLHEFCTLSKSLQMVQQVRLLRDLVNEGMFDIIVDILQSSDKKLVLMGTDILILLNQDPNLLRSHVIRQEGLTLFGLLVRGMLTDFGDDMHCQFNDILRSLLDSYASGLQRDTIVEIFYEKHLTGLVQTITLSCPPNRDSLSVSESENTDGGNVKQSCVKPEILLNICDLLCFCAVHHPYRIKCSFLLNNVVDKVLLLTRRREKYLVVAAVRFMRTLISRNDEYLMNHIAEKNLLKPIVNAFVANGDRYNLLNSAVLELFEYIRKDNLKILLKYLVDSFWDELVKFEKFSSINSLKVKYEQSLEDSGMRSVGNLLDPRKRVDERSLEKEEEDYFNEESDEEDSASASVVNASRVKSQLAVPKGSAPSYTSDRSGGVVDSGDDDNDEDYKPPPKKQSDNSDEDGADSFPLKRKVAPKEDPEPKRLQRVAKGSKSRDSVFAALCSTLSQAVLPSKTTESPADNGSAAPGSPQSDENKRSVEANHDEEGSLSDNGNADFENHANKQATSPKKNSESLHKSPDSRKHEEDCPLIQPKSSPEMAVNGS